MRLKIKNKITCLIYVLAVIRMRVVCDQREGDEGLRNFEHLFLGSMFSPGAEYMTLTHEIRVPFPAREP